MKRIMLFLLTNIAVIFILSIVLRLLGVDRILDESGTNLNMYNLLIFAAVFGYGRRADFPDDIQMDGQATDGSESNHQPQKFHGNLAGGYGKKAGVNGGNRHAGSGDF